MALSNEQLWQIRSDLSVLAYKSVGYTVRLRLL